MVSNKWSLPAIKLRCGSQFLLRVRAPNGALHSMYAINVAVNSVGPEADVSDNAAQTTVVLWKFVYLPMVQR